MQFAPHQFWRATHLTPLVLAAVVLSATACSDDDVADPTTTTIVTERRSIVLDYSPTVSDAGALLYLAAHPDVDLLAVTLPGTGEADCESGVHTTEALLVAAGRDGVPVACGREQPMVGARDWPEEWRNAHEGWADLLPDVPDAAIADAEQRSSAPTRSWSTPSTKWW